MTTTNKEHMAMVAAGMSDEELRDVLRDGPDYFSYHFLRAVGDELENREQARFQMKVEAR